MSLVLSPYRPICVIACRGVEAEMDVHNVDKEPGHDSQDLVGEQGAGGVGFPLGEGVV